MEEKRDAISARQLAAIVWAALLTSCAGVLPGATAALAGEAAWLSTVIALPAVLLLGAAVGRLTRRRGRSLPQALERAFGAAAGRLALLLYMVWALVLCAVRLRLGGERLLLTGQRDGGLWLFLPVTAALGLWLTWGKLAAFARTAELFSWALTLALGGVLALTVFQIRAKNLWPVSAENAGGALRAAAAALGALCAGVYGGFLLDDVSPLPGDGRRWRRWSIEGCAALSAMQLWVIGNFGAGLTAQMEIPFITLTKSVGVEGAFQRVEGLMAALWLFSDLALVGLLLWAFSRMAVQLWPACRRRWAAAAGAAAALAGAACMRDLLAVQRFERTGLLAGNLLLGAAVPVLALALSEWKEKKG